MAIYKCHRARASEAWYQLSRAEKDSLRRKLEESLTQVGGKMIVECRSGWASEQWEYFGVEEFPDIEAVQKHRELLDEFEFFRYYETDILLGTTMA